MKQVASTAIQLPNIWIYTGNKRELQDSSSFPIVLLKEQNEPVGDKTRIASVFSLKKATSADLGI
jgi:hypothetical protein